MKNKIYFNECENHSLFEPKPAPHHCQQGGIIWCLDCTHQSKCLEDSKKIDKYKIGKKVIYYGFDGKENIKGKIINPKKIKWSNNNDDFFVVKLEKPDKHNANIIEMRKRFSPYNLTAL